MIAGTQAMSEPIAKPLWQRLAAPAVIVALMAIGYSLGLHKHLSLQSIAENREALLALTSANLTLAVAAFVGVYIVAVALSFPGAVVLTVAGGLLFGWLVGGFASIIGATLGAGFVFHVAKSSFGDALAKKAGPFLSKLKDGFADDAFNYLLFLRLVPAFPFWLVNIASALANVKLRTFMLATFIGIIPGTFAFAFVGSGLDSIIAAQTAAHEACLAANPADACPFALSVSSLITKELLLAFVTLGVVALIPVGLKKWKAKL